jgi:hypothetical protein
MATQAQLRERFRIAYREYTLEYDPDNDCEIRRYGEWTKYQDLTRVACKGKVPTHLRANLPAAFYMMETRGPGSTITLAPYGAKVQCLIRRTQ